MATETAIGGGYDTGATVAGNVISSGSVDYGYGYGQYWQHTTPRKKTTTTTVTERDKDGNVIKEVVTTVEETVDGDYYYPRPYQIYNATYSTG